jgi:hypothetical protein
MLRQAVANTADLKITKCVRGTTSIQENAGFAAIRAKRSKAVDRFAASLKPVIAEIRAKGAKNQTAIAKELNNLGHRTQKGSQWDSNSVGALLGRQAALNRRSDSASSVGLGAEINKRSSVVTADCLPKQAADMNDQAGFAEGGVMSMLLGGVR